MKWKHWRFYGFPNITSIEKQAKNTNETGSNSSSKYLHFWQEWKFYYKSRTLSLHNTVPLAGDNHLTILFWIDSKCWKKLKNFINGIFLFQENKKHENALAFAHFTCQHNFHQRTPKTSLPNSFFLNGPYSSLTSWYKDWIWRQDSFNLFHDWWRRSNRESCFWNWIRVQPSTSGVFFDTSTFKKTKHFESIRNEIVRRLPSSQRHGIMSWQRLWLTAEVSLLSKNQCSCCKIRFEPVSFIFVACFSMDVIRGNRRISNSLIS